MLNTIIAVMIAVILVTSISVSAYARPQEVISDTVYLYIWEVSNEFDISPFLLASLVYQESRFIVTDNLTQITNKKWFREDLAYCESDDITNPYVNIRVCGYYLNKWLQNHTLEESLSMWNTGKFLKTSRYAREIIERSEQWEQSFEESISNVCQNNN